MADRAAPAKRAAQRIDARARGLALALQKALERIAAEELRAALADPWRYAGVKRAPVAKQKDPPRENEEIARLVRMYGLQQATAAGKAAAGRPVIPESLVRTATEGKPVKIEWVDRLVGGAPKRARDIDATTREQARASVKRILTEALGEETQPGPAEIARRIRTAFQGPEVEREQRVHASKKGRDYVFSSERAAVIARTELAQAENTGIFEGYRATGVEEIEWSAYQDGRSGDRHHERMDGVRVRVGELFMLPSGAKLRYPGDPSAPIGETVNCFLGEVEVSAANPLSVSRRWYSGEIVRVRTRSGRILSGTPNHPILTSKGWVALGALDEGHHLVDCSLGDEIRSTAANPNLIPSKFAEKFDLALSADVGVRKNLSGNLHFHGDGMDGEVDIVPVKRHLDTRIVASLAKGEEHDRLTSAVFLFGVGAARRALLQLSVRTGRSSDCVVRCLREASPLFGAGPAHPGEHGVASVSWLDASLDQAPPDGWPTGPGSLGDGEFALSAVVSLDDVTDVEREPFHGFVFNLETVDGWYIANGIVAHNCRCSLIPVAPSEVRRDRLPEPVPEEQAGAPPEVGTTAQGLAGDLTPPEPGADPRLIEAERLGRQMEAEARRLAREAEAERRSREAEAKRQAELARLAAEQEARRRDVEAARQRQAEETARRIAEAEERARQATEPKKDAKAERRAKERAGYREQLRAARGAGAKPQALSPAAIEEQRNLPANGTRTPGMSPGVAAAYQRTARKDLAPTGSFEPDKLASAFDRLADNPSDQRAQVEIRRALSEIMAEYRLVNRDSVRGAPRSGDVEIDNNMRAGGQYNVESGVMRIPEKTARSIARFLRGERNSETIYPMHVAIHEAAHGHSAAAYVKGFGLVAEEVTTELAARRIMRESFGERLSSGSYQDWIRPFFEELKQAGLSHTEVMEQASFIYKRGTTRDIDGPDAVLDRLSSAISEASGLPSSEARAITKRALEKAQVAMERDYG